MNKPKAFSKPAAARQSGSPVKRQTLLRVLTSKAGNLYAEAVADITLKKGDRLTVNDPRKFLSEEQVNELEETGKIVLKTPSGKEYTLYSSLVSEIVKLGE